MTDTMNVDRLQYGDKEIILVGTAHVSRESTDLVRRVIEENSPDTVCVELCADRRQAMEQGDQWREMDILKVVKEKKAFLLLANLMLASFQRRVASRLEVRPGEEMRAAIKAAEAQNAAVVNADRNIRITLGRAWRAMRLRDKARLLMELLLSGAEIDEISEDDIEEMKQRDMLDGILRDVGERMPALKRILIDERDRYLTEKIRTAPGRRIVAVVGAGHVPGIRAGWEEPVDITALEWMPRPGKLGAVLKWMIPILIIGLIGAGFAFGGKSTGTDMAVYWLLANGILAGAGAIAALAHPLTFLAAVAAAPLTSLNPMVAAGWVSGLAEAWLRKPRVRDFESLSDDILTIRGFWRNKVTRVLLVVAFTNIGSILGTFVAIPLMMRAMS